MHIRQSFVANSSSASFIILKKGLNTEQIFHLQTVPGLVTIARIIHPNEEYLKEENPGNGWEIAETETTIKGWTIIDNLGIRDILMWLRIPWENIEELDCDN